MNRQQQHTDSEIRTNYNSAGLKRKQIYLLISGLVPHEGVIRPFLNWGSYLSKDHDIHFILLNCGKQLTDFVKKIENTNFVTASNFEDILRYIDDANDKPDVLITDDDIHRLKLTTAIKEKRGIRTCVYIQILFGIHAIADVFDLKRLSFKERKVFSFVKLLSFNMLKSRYKQLISKQDVIVSNSQITSMLLYLLYGTESAEIIYPPVDTRTFVPGKEIKEKQVLLYLGSNAGDTNITFIKQICKELHQRQYRILVMGNRSLQEEINSEFIAEHLSNVTDEKLAKIYSKCLLTICPQRWEQFGYVAAESSSCGTPVLAFEGMGPSEIISKSGFGFLAQNEKQFLEIITRFVENSSTFGAHNTSGSSNNKDSAPWSIETSSIKLLQAIS